MKKLVQLIKNNAGYTAPPIRSEAEPATIYVYDVIDNEFGISALSIVTALSEMRGQPVALRINSPGGDVFAARSMAAAIAAHGDVTAHIDGVAASAATTIALAAKHVTMNEGGLFMIHNGWMMSYGNKHELRESANLLDKVDAQIVADYARKTGKSAEQIVQWMDAETWFNATEAKDAGFINDISTNVPAKNTWNLSAYDNAPKRVEATEPEPDWNAIQQRNLNRLRLHEIG